jgi:hypothetical protein
MIQNLLLRSGKAAALSALVLGLSLFVYGFAHPTDDHYGTRVMLVGVVVALFGWGAILSWLVFARGHTLLDVYRSGYRTGRRDSQEQLLEDGLYLISKAEHDAERAYDANGDS